MSTPPATTTTTTTSSSVNNNSNSNNRIQVTFEDFEDLTSRLVLLPRVEDEGVGAVVASLLAAAPVAHDAPCCKPSKGDAQQQQQSPEEDSTMISSVSSDSTECRDEKEDCFSTTTTNKHNTPTDTNNQQSLVGCVLVGTSTSKEDWQHADFATILAAMRGQPGPIVLELEQPAATTAEDVRLDKSSSASEASALSSDDDDDDDSSGTCSVASVGNGSAPQTAATRQAAQTPTTNNNNNTGGPPTTILSSPTPNSTAAATPNSNTMARWSAWGSRMKAQAQMAAENAQTAAVHSLQAAAAHRAAALQADNEANGVLSDENDACCGIHVQTSLGAFLPLANNNNNNKSKPSNNNNSSSLSSPRSSHSELSVTISSVLYIRRSAVEACPPRGYTYQWYKGLPGLVSSSLLEDDWILLPGANSAAFQPSTTEVGYKLLCLVVANSPKSLLDSDYDDDSDSDSDDDDDEDSHAASKEPTIVRCMSPDVVAADISLFNGARQALIRGAHFGGLQGQGRAQGRTFRVQVEMGCSSHRHKNKKAVVSSVKIDQVSGATAEPLHATPFYHVSAHSVHTASKNLELQFRAADLADSASLMSALVTDDGIFELVAPNRFARESLLLAIGIANFKGKPSELDATTILYSSAAAAAEVQEDGNDESSSSSDDGSTASSPASDAASLHSDAGASHDSHTTPVKSPHGPKLVENLQLSPAFSAQTPQPIDDDDDDDQSVSSEGDLSTIASSSSVNAEAPPARATPQKVRELLGPTQREAELEQEMAFLRTKLAKKDKVVSELQRQVTRSDGALQHANQHASKLQQQVDRAETDVQSSQRVQKAAEHMVDQSVCTVKKLKADQSLQISKLNQQLESQSSAIADLEKTVKSHSNEKAVLTAAVEARESKLGKLAELQESYVALSSKVSQQDQWRKELGETTQRYQELKGDLQKVSQLEKECQNELQSTKETLQSLTDETQAAKDTATSCREELKVVQTKNQKLKSERNSYKQKADSLAKEISRICRNGRTLADIERVLANDEAMQEEVQLLRKQKRKVLEECHSYRRSYEQSRAAQQLMMHANASPKSKKADSNNSALLLERNVELERLVTELTEYVNAKEMQLETMKQVTSALQEEIHGLAKAIMHKDEI